LQSAESILVEECIKFTQNDMLKKEMLFLSQKSHDSDRPTPILDSAIRKILQNDLPNLWTVVMALITENSRVRQKDRADIVFTTLFVMCCSGHASMSELGSWVSDYLNDGHRTK